MTSDPLGKLLETGRIPHALLIVDGKESATRFARELVGATGEHHPDLHILRPEGKSGLHPVENVRKLTHDMSLSPFQAPYKVFIIEEAERMLPSSSNALLKTFEEPTEGTIILLLTRHREKLLPTILSRCQTYYYHETAAAFTAQEAVVLAMQGDLSRLHEIEEALEGGHEQEAALLELAMRLARDAFLTRAGVSTDHCFFPDTGIKIGSLSKFEERARKARLGFERNIKPSAVLSFLFR